MTARLATLQQALDWLAKNPHPRSDKTRRLARSHKARLTAAQGVLRLLHREKKHEGKSPHHTICQNQIQTSSPKQFYGG
jgi:hypothetical protein